MVPSLLKILLIRSYLGVFFTFYFTLVFGRKFKKYSFKFSRFSINRTTTFRSVTHRVVECLIAYFKTMFVTSPID